MYPPKNVSQIVLLRKNELGARIKESTYGKLSTELGISKGVLWKFINTDYIPTSIELKRKLGLPEPIIIYRTRNPKGQFESYD